MCSISKTNILFILSTLCIACKNNVSVHVDYELQENAKYEIKKNETLRFNNFESQASYISEFEVNDLPNIAITVVKDEVLMNGNDMQFFPESNNHQPNYGESQDAKIVHAVNSDSFDTDIRIAKAINAWNAQKELPLAKLSKGEPFITESNNKENTGIIYTEYRLNAVVDDLAYISFVENTVYENEFQNIRKSNDEITSSTGELEYDLKNKNYQLIHTVKKTNSKQKGTETYKEGNYSFYHETTIRINKLE